MTFGVVSSRHGASFSGPCCVGASWQLITSDRVMRENYERIKICSGGKSNHLTLSARCLLFPLNAESMSLSAANASEALAILCQENIDLVVSDIRMPGKDRMELMQEAHREFLRYPFIIMTGYSSEYSYEGIIDAGASDFIVKPFSLDELKAKICRIQKSETP